VGCGVGGTTEGMKVEENCVGRGEGWGGKGGGVFLRFVVRAVRGGSDHLRLATFPVLLLMLAGFGWYPQCGNL